MLITGQELRNRDGFGNVSYHPNASVPARIEPQSAEPSAIVEAYLRSAIDSEETRRAYERALARFLAWLPVDLLADLTGAMLAQYRAELLNREVSPSAHAQELAAVRSFLRWTRSMGGPVPPHDTVREALRTPRTSVLRPYVTLSESEVGALLRAAEHPRDRAIVAVLVSAGLRVGEMVNLNVSDVGEDVQGGMVLHVRQGKGRRDRTVPIRPDVALCIRQYLASTGRTMGEAGPLFRAHDRGAKRRVRSRLSAQAVGALLVRLAKNAGLQGKRVAPHALRHTSAIRMLRAGANETSVGRILGHANPSTTRRYLDHLELGELRESIPELPV